MTKFYAIRMPANYYKLSSRHFDESSYPDICDACGRPMGGGEAIPPVKIRFEKHIKTADFVWASTEMLVVDKVKRAFEAGGVRGIEYLDVSVRIVGTYEKLHSNLWQLHLHHAAHAAPQMNIVPIEYCPVCGMTIYSTWDGGVVVDENTWDGSDLFRLYEDVAGIIATAKIKQIVDLNGFTGVSFIPAEEFHDPYPESRPRPRKSR